MAKKEKKALRWLIDIILIIVGGLIYSLGLHCFTAPNDIAPGGVAGVSTVIYHLSGINVGVLYGLINVPLIIIGFIFLGKSLMIKTIISVGVITAATDYLFIKIPVYTGDKVIASLFGGLLIGIGLGICYLREGTSGGTDIINKIINKKLPYVSFGKIMLATDAAVIVLAMAVYGNIESGLYAIVAIFVSSKVVDVILYGNNEGKLILVFSGKFDEISKTILTEMHRGVTLLQGEGAYTGKSSNVICCAVHKNEYVKLKRRVKEIDPNAFIIIATAGEVLGEGFHEIN